MDFKNKAPNFSEDIPPKYLQELCVARMSVYIAFLSVASVDVHRKPKDADVFVFVGVHNSYYDEVDIGIISW